jgi:SagB-type dehydrogenase family enzyme
LKKHPTASSIAEFYHELTKYSPENLSANLPDPLLKPPPFKEYLSRRAVDLKPFLKAAAAPAGRGGERGPLTSLSRLLYHTAGITHVLEGRGGSTYFRAAPSAGALYPIELYLATRGAEGLTDGIHSYSPREHSLIPIWEGDFGPELEQFCLRHPAALAARIFLILTAVFRRSAWRYRDRAYRRILLDAGHVLGNAVAYGPREGLCVTAMAGFHDAALNDLLFFDREEEAVILMGTVVPQKEMESIPAGDFPAGSAASPPPTGAGEGGVMHLLHEHSGIEPSRKGREPPRSPLGPSAADGQASSEAPIPLAPPSFVGEPGLPTIGQVIRRRRSTRAFTKGTLSLGTVGAILRWAYLPARAGLLKKNPQPGEGAEGGPGPGEAEAAGTVRRAVIDSTMISTHLVMTRVEGLPAGLYRLDVESMSLIPRRRGNFQTELWNLCLGQELGRDAAAAVIQAADLPSCVERYGDRAYRYLHLDAGHLGERINLAAVARQVGVSGIGGFFDEEVNELLGLPEKVSTLYITLLGQPGSKTERE